VTIENACQNLTSIGDIHKQNMSNLTSVGDIHKHVSQMNSERDNDYGQQINSQSNEKDHFNSQHIQQIS